MFFICRLAVAFQSWQNPPLLLLYRQQYYNRLHPQRPQLLKAGNAPRVRSGTRILLTAAKCVNLAAVWRHYHHPLQQPFLATRANRVLLYVIRKRNKQDSNGNGSSTFVAALTSNSLTTLSHPLTAHCMAMRPMMSIGLDQPKLLAVLHLTSSISSYTIRFKTAVINMFIN